MPQRSVSPSSDQRNGASGPRRRLATILLVVAAMVLGLTSPVAAKSKDDKKASNACSATGGYSATDTIGSMYNVNAAIGAHAAWAAGHTGDGIDIALIDTGVVPVRGLDGDDKIVNGPDFSIESADEAVRHLDTYGHGTHLAGIIAGNDGGLPTIPEADTGKKAKKGKKKDEVEVDEAGFYGVAPDSRIVNVKVADHTGAVDVSQVIAAIDWVVANRSADGMNIRVLNLSYRADSDHPYEHDPLARAVENAWNNGIVVVVAAGNDGEKTKKLASPARDPFVIAVSAVYDKEQDKTSCRKKKLDWKVTDWASAADKKNRQPDLYAPGATIVSLRNPGSMVDVTHPSSAIADRFAKATGTSQSAAVVSGAVALLLDADPDLTPDEVKAILMASSTDKEQIVDLSTALVTEAPKKAEQRHKPSRGDGSLEGTRGGEHIVVDGQALTGEHTLFGEWTPQTWLETSADGAAWTGSSWTGSSWTGSSWTGSSWTGSSWTGSSWTGSSWTGSSWTGSSWTGSSWTGSSWTGSSWTGSAWASSTWG